MRPQTSQAVIDIVTKIVDSQDEKGWKKYSVTIDDAKDEEYNWYQMAVEELVDGMKYMVKENQRLQNELNHIHSEVKKLLTTVQAKYIGK